MIRPWPVAILVSSLAIAPATARAAGCVASERDRDVAAHPLEEAGRADAAATLRGEPLCPAPPASTGVSEQEVSQLASDERATNAVLVQDGLVVVGAVVGAVAGTALGVAVGNLLPEPCKNGPSGEPPCKTGNPFWTAVGVGDVVGGGAGAITGAYLARKLAPGDLRGHPSHRAFAGIASGAVAGAIIGVPAGATVGALSLDPSCNSFSCGLAPFIGAVIGAGVGALTGGVAGFALLGVDWSSHAPAAQTAAVPFPGDGEAATATPSSAARGAARGR